MEGARTTCCGDHVWCLPTPSPHPRTFSRFAGYGLSHLHPVPGIASYQIVAFALAVLKYHSEAVCFLAPALGYFHCGMDTTLDHAPPRVFERGPQHSAFPSASDILHLSTSPPLLLLLCTGGQKIRSRGQESNL